MFLLMMITSLLTLPLYFPNSLLMLRQLDGGCFYHLVIVFLYFNSKMGVGAMATNSHRFPNIMLPKSLDGDSAPIRYQTDVPLMVKALLFNRASLALLILRKLLQGLWETFTQTCADTTSNMVA